MEASIRNTSSLVLRLQLNETLKDLGIFCLMYMLASLDCKAFGQMDSERVFISAGWSGSALLGVKGSLLGAQGCPLVESTDMHTISSPMYVRFSMGGKHLTGFVLHNPKCQNLLASYANAKKGQPVSETNYIVEMDRRSMEKWLDTKPLGFGHGKMYDTSIEDKLLEEMERDKAAQAAALLRKKKNAGTQIEIKQLKKVLEPPPNGVKVRIGDLPKKRNIERDLQMAFKGVQGLLQIEPSVLGNEKTRDPICKGFGFLTFKDINSAESFLSSFQGEPILFGKVMKKPSYKLLSNSSENATGCLPQGTKMKVPTLRVRDKTATLDGLLAADVLRTSAISAVPFDSTVQELGKQSKMEDLAEDNRVAIDTELVDGALVITDTIDDTDTCSKPLEEDLILSSAEDVLVQENATSSQKTSCEEHDYFSEESDGDASIEEYDDSSEEGGLWTVSVEDEAQNVHVSYVMESDDLSSEAIVINQSSNIIAADEIEQARGQTLSADDRRIEELEKRLWKKLESAGLGQRKESLEEPQEKPRGFSPKASKPSKKTTNNSLGSAKRLKKKERDFLIGALEKYGKKP